MKNILFPLLKGLLACCLAPFRPRRAGLHAAIKRYLPFSAAKNSMTAHIAGVGSNSGSDTDYSFIYYAGLGLEGNLTQDWILGLEMRYSQFVLDTSQLVKNGGDEYFSFLAFMLKLSYRF